MPWLCASRLAREIPLGVTNGENGIGCLNPYTRVSSCVHRTSFEVIETAGQFRSPLTKIFPAQLELLQHRTHNLFHKDVPCHLKAMEHFPVNLQL